MKKDEKNGLPGRTMRTRSLASASPELRRSSRGKPCAKPISPATSTRKSERLSPSISPASVTAKSCRMDKEKTASPLRRSDRGKNVSSESSKGSDKSGRNANTTSDIEKSKDNVIDDKEESISNTKKQKPRMTGRRYRALFRKKEVRASSNDEVVVVVGCSRRVPAGDDDARDDISLPLANSESIRLPVDGTSLEKDTDFPVELIGDVPAGNDDTGDSNSSPQANSESKRLPVEETGSEKDNNFPVKLIRDVPSENEEARDGISSARANSESKRLPVDETSLEEDIENLVLDAPNTAETGEDSVMGFPSERSETQYILVSTTTLETDIGLPPKRKRDTAGFVVDACADGVTPSLSGRGDNNQLERCSSCEKRQKVSDDFDYRSVCPCISQPVQESDHAAQKMKESGPATSRDCGENRQNIQQDKSYDPKLLSMYREYWVPVQLSDVQLEQYCRTLLSQSLSLSSVSKKDFGALEEIFISVRKTCDHPYVSDGYLKQMLTKNLKLHEYVDVEVKASGKLHLLDAMLTQIKTNGLKAVVFYQATKSPEGLPLANILDDFMSHRFGQNSYEHGVCLAKKNAINNFNKEGECFVLLLETRACSQTIKLLRAEAFILFGSSLNPSHDVKLIEKIKIESNSEKTKIFRLYSTYTVEEKALILARQNKPLDNLNRQLTHALLMWGASYLFDKLEYFHGGETPGFPFEQSIKDDVIQEFSLILSSKVGEENEGKLCLLLEAKHAHGHYSTDSTLFGEKCVKVSDEDSPNILWTKLLGGKNPKWKYYLDAPQRCRKRVQVLQGIEEAAKIADGGNIKKRKKAPDDVTVDNNKRNASGKDHMGALESPKALVHESPRRSASDSNGPLDGKDAFGLYSVGGRISRIPEDMLAGMDWRQHPRESQRHLHAILKSEMAKLCQVLHLSEASTSMVEKFLKYVIESHYVCKEPTTTLQALQIALSWIAVSLVEQKLDHDESVVCANSELRFECSREEVDYIYTMLYCMKSLFLESTQGATVRQEKSNRKLVRSSKGEECMTEKGGGHYSALKSDIETAFRKIKKKCNKLQKYLEEKNEEKKLEVMKKYEDKKQRLEKEKEVERAIIRIQCRWTSTQSLEDDIKRLDHDHERKINQITSERDEELNSLEQMHEAERKELAEDEACWISRLEKWVQADLISCASIKSGSDNHLSSSNTFKNTPDVQIRIDADAEATYAGKDCMVSKGIQVLVSEDTLGTMSGSSTQQAREILASRNEKTTFSGEKPTSSAATKSKSNENDSIIAPEVLISAGCQDDSAALNVPSERQIYDRLISAPPEDVPLPDISESSANFAKSASLDFYLNREETSLTVENNRISPVGSDSDCIVDQQSEEACSLNKDIPYEFGFPKPHPTSAVETRSSTESDQDDEDICLLPSPRPDPAANIEDQIIEVAVEPQPAGSPIPSSPAGQQPDPAVNSQGQNIEAVIEPQPAGSETVVTGGFAASEQGDKVQSPLSFSPAGNQPDLTTNIEGPNTNASATPNIAGPGSVEIVDSAASDQEIVGAQNACSLPSSLVETQTDLAANAEGQNITTVAQLHIADTDAAETGGSPLSYQIAQDASPLPFSSAINHPDAAVNSERLDNTPLVEPHISESDACEMEIAEPGPLAEQPTCSNNVAVHEGRVEPSAGVTAPVASLLNSGTGQSSAQPVPHIPFPVFSDPFQHELEKLRRESENSKKAYEERKSILKAELERKMAELQAEYQRKFREVEAKHKTKTTEIETSRNLVRMNKLLANAFLSKCLNRIASNLSEAPRDRVEQLVQRAAQVSALHNYAATAPAPAPLQPPTSSLSRPTSLLQNTVNCPMPQPRQPLITNISPSFPASPATNPSLYARQQRAPSPYINLYRSSSTYPIPTTSTTSLPLPQTRTVPVQLLQQEQRQQQQQVSNDVVCLSDSDDE